MTNDEPTSDDPLTAAVAAILADADADIASRNPICKNSGRCCKFESYGHRLYVTAAELHHFNEIENRKLKIEIRNAKTEPLEKSVSLIQFFTQQKPEGCPYQIDGFCTAREARPLGCRIYFCDESAQSWQNDVYEKYHAQLQALHAQFNLPYRYLEWRVALRELLPENAKS